MAPNFGIGVDPYTYMPTSFELEWPNPAKFSMVTYAGHGERRSGGSGLVTLPNSRGGAKREQFLGPLQTPMHRLTLSDRI